MHTKLNETKEPNLIDSTMLGLRDTFTINKTMGRADYWWFWLGMIIIKIVLLTILGLGLLMIFSSLSFNMNHLGTLITNTISGILILGGLSSLVAIFIAKLTAAIRRYHDINMSGFFFLLLFIPTFGFLINLIFMVMPQNNNNNKWLQPENTDSNTTSKTTTDGSKLLMQRRAIIKSDRYL